MPLQGIRIIYPKYKDPVRFHVLTAASIKFTVFWDILPYSKIDIDRRFRGAFCLHYQGDDGGRMHL
jgi:hypothetical protein